MGICPNCGSWVDEGDICHGCGGVRISSSQDDDDYDSPPVESRADKLGKKAYDLYYDNKLDDALYYINLALESNRMHANNWNRKAIILEYMERFDESEECYNKSLNISRQKLVCENKARMLKKWAGHLSEESKKQSNALPMLEKALEINRKAINSLPTNTEEKIDNYNYQTHMIESEMEYEKEYHKNVEKVKKYDKSELFTITGTQYCDVKIRFMPGMSLKLVKELDNKSDKDAIAVYVEDKKVGYVANSNFTKFEHTSSASELHNKIGNDAKGEFLIELLKLTPVNYMDKRFYIGKIINYE